MSPHSTFQDLIDHLRYLTPPQGVAYIGAGTGASAARYADWSVNTGVLIEADESYYEKLTQVIKGHKGWSVHTAMMSDQESETLFYQASNPNESGLLLPEGMAKLWQNLKTIEERCQKTTTLERLLITADILPDCLNWLVIECLPALPIIKGAGKYMTGWDVIIARVLLDENLCPGQGATKLELDSFLLTQGYRCIFVEEERQPALASALYLRDWKAEFCSRQTQLEQTQKEKDEQCMLVAERQAQIERLTQEHGQKDQGLAEHQTQVAQLQGELHQIIGERDGQTERVTELHLQLEQVKAEQEKLAAGMQVQIEQLSLERNEQANLTTEWQKQAERLTNERDEHNRISGERLAHIKQLIQTSDEQQDLIRHLQEGMEKLNSSVAETTEELRQARQSANLAIKLQTLREADLEDLQIRYKEAVNVQERQHLLMLQLEDKLRLASQYFHQLRDRAVSPIAVTSEESTLLEKPIRKRVTTKQKSGKSGQA